MSPIRPPSRLLLAAFVAFLAANLIHNRMRVDVAIAPAALLLAFDAWRPSRWLRLAAAVFIGIPALAFFRFAALLEPERTLPFLNHVCLLLAGLFAIAGGVRALMPAWRRP